MDAGLRPCPTCGAPVAPGRLSCAACGTLLASVSGRAALPALGAPPTGTEGSGSALEEAAVPLPEAAPLPPPPALPPRPPEPELPPRPQEPDLPPPPVLHPLPEGAPAPGARPGAGTQMPAYTSVPAGSGPSGPLATNQWYSSQPGYARPAMAPPAMEPAAAPPSPATAGLLSDLPFSAPSTIAAWVAAAGSFLAGAAVVLPWRATPGLPYLTDWGAAMPAVVIAAILAIVAGLIAITPSRLAPRVRWGYVPFFVGGFGLGAAWMWQSTYAADVGLWVYVLGSIIAAAGGALSLSGWAEPTT